MKAFKLIAAMLPALLATQARATFCNNDDDCACGQVCSYLGVGQACVAAGTDPGWCSQGQPDNGGCLYAGQVCCGIYCYPAWSPDAGCLKQSDGGLGISNTSGVSCPTGGSSGSSSNSTAASSSTSGGGSSSVAASGSSGGSKSFAPSSTSAGTSSEAGGSTGGSSAVSTSSTTGGGGCSQAPGELSFAALLAVVLLARSRRRRD